MKLYQTAMENPMQTRVQSAAWYDLLTFLTMAALLGILVGIALGGVALLLTGSAHGAERRAPELQAPVHRAAYYDAREDEANAAEPGPAGIVLPACEGQAPRTDARRLEM